MSNPSETEHLKSMIDLLARASEVVGSSLDLEKTREQVVRVLVPNLSDWAVLLGLDEQGLYFLKSFHREPAQDKLLRTYCYSVEPLLFQSAYIEQAILQGEARFGSFSFQDCQATMPPSQILCIPLVKNNEVTGILCLGAETPRSFMQGAEVIGQEIVNRAAFALENAQLYQNAINRESQLIEAKRQAELSSTAKTQFLASMSHEIRSPLSAILGFSELLLAENSQNPEQLDWAQRISHNGAHLLRLIDEILNISKIESGKVEIENRMIHFSQLLNQICISETPKAVKKGLTLKFRFETELPEKFISDSTRLNQILTNLIGNAIKFTDSGGVEVLLRYEAAKNFLVVIVSDTGAGLTREQAQKLFSPFAQGDISHNRKFGGTGLGLTVCRQLARLMGGDVEILETTPGMGSRFQMILPIQTEPGGKVFSHLESAFSVEPAQEPRKKQGLLSGFKILVVDDLPDNCLLVCRMLIRAGAEVVSANSGAQGIEKALTEDFSVVLMDIQMPDMNGKDVVRELRRRGFQRPVIALTASALSTEKDQCLKAGCAAFVTKPLDREELLQTIYKLASGSSLRLLDPMANTQLGLSH